MYIKCTCKNAQDIKKTLIMKVQNTNWSYDYESKLLRVKYRGFLVFILYMYTFTFVHAFTLSTCTYIDIILFENIRVLVSVLNS